MKTKDLLDTTNDCSAILAFLSHSFSTTPPSNNPVPMSTWAETGLSLILGQLSLQLSEASASTEKEVLNDPRVISIRR